MDERVFIFKNGIITSLYTDEINLHAIGRVHVERASSIEYDNAAQCWRIQLADGSHCGCGFTSREDALKAEIEFLQERL